MSGSVLEAAPSASRRRARRSRSARPSQRRLFALDRRRCLDIRFGGRRSAGRVVRAWLLEPDLRAVACYRFSHAAAGLYSRHRLIGLLPRLISRLWRQRFLTRHHLWIQQEAEIGPGLYIAHFHGIQVGPVAIGANCTIYHNVTLGRQLAGGGDGVPTLGDNVWIGPGSTLTGAITVGNNVTISAGTVLSKSVPDGCLVAGNPGRVIQQDHDNSALVTYPVPVPRNGQVERHDT